MPRTQSERNSPACAWPSGATERGSAPPRPASPPSPPFAAPYEGGGLTMGGRGTADAASSITKPSAWPRSWRVWQRQPVDGGGGRRGGWEGGRKRRECPAGWWVLQPKATLDFAQDASHRRRGCTEPPTRRGRPPRPHRFHPQSGGRVMCTAGCAAQLKGRSRALRTVTRAPTDATRHAKQT